MGVQVQSPIGPPMGAPVGQQGDLGRQQRHLKPLRHHRRVLAQGGEKTQHRLSVVGAAGSADLVELGME